MGLLRLYRSSSIGRIADWASLVQLAAPALTFCGGGALLTWAASSIEPIMQYGWGAAILVGLAAVCLIILTLSAGAFAFRALLPSKTNSSPEDLVLPGGSLADTSNEIGAVISDVEALKKIAQLHYEDFDRRFAFASQRLGSMLERMERYDRLLAPPKEGIRLHALGEHISSPEDRFEAIERDVRETNAWALSTTKILEENKRAFDEKIEQLQTDTYDSLEKVRKVILSERILDSYDSMTNSINELIARMNDPLSKPETYTAWSVWEDDFAAFKTQISAFERFLRNHIGRETNLFDTPPDLYKSQNWSYNFQNLDEDQKINYKTFRIMSRNYESITEDIRSGLYNSTFLNL